MNEASFRREILTILQEYADADYWGDWLHDEDNPYDYVDRIVDLCGEYFVMKTYRRSIKDAEEDSERIDFSLDDLHG